MKGRRLRRVCSLMAVVVFVLQKKNRVTSPYCFLFIDIRASRQSKCQLSQQATELLTLHYNGWLLSIYCNARLILANYWKPFAKSSRFCRPTLLKLSGFRPFSKIIESKYLKMNKSGSNLPIQRVHSYSVTLFNFTSQQNVFFTCRRLTKQERRQQQQ